MEKRRMIALIAALLLCLPMAFAGTGLAEGAGKHLNAALYWFGGSLDPAADWDGWTTCRAGITETLVTVNSNYEIVPLLADSWEQTDDTTWVMHIREGVTFHNGKPVDGEAVKKSLERAMQTQDRATTAAKIAGIEADGQNVTITTSEPFGAFLANISEPMYSIIDVDAGTDFASQPIATGPFMVTGFEVNTEIDLARYDGYWNGASDIETLTVLCISDDSTRGMALQGGQVDVVQRVSWTDIPSFEANSDFDVYNTLGARTRMLEFNYKNPFLADVNVRKALSLSINYEALIGVLGSGVGMAGAPYPASSPYGYDQLDRQHYDLEAAKALLAESGFEDSDGNGYLDKDGEELQFTISYDNASFTTMLEAIQDMAKQAGFHLELKVIESSDFLGGDGEFDIVCGNIQVLSTGDPQWYLSTYFKSDSPNNVFGYSNPEVDRVIDELARTFDIESRTAKTIEAEKLLLEDCGAIWVVGENNFVVANAKVRNVVPYPIDYYFLDNTITIE